MICLCRLLLLLVCFSQFLPELETIAAYYILQLCINRVYQLRQCDAKSLYIRLG